jgi:2-octaprenyl-6-methoxyphenol hydroxylase
MRALALGDGEGRNGVWLAQQGLAVTSLDWSPVGVAKAAQLARRRGVTVNALVGDAAHGIHPIAGQGLNLGFRDVAALAEALVEAVAAGEDPGSAAVLARYQARARPDAMLMLGATHVLEKLFGNDFGPVRLARRLGIAAVDRIPALKRAFAERAMGMRPGLAGLLGGQGLMKLG